MKKLVHSSTNSHFVENAVKVEPEKKVVADAKTTITHTEHETLPLYPGNHTVGFVKTYNHAQRLAERVKD